MKPYKIIDTREAEHVNAVYWDIEYNGKVYEVWSYYSGKLRDSVFSGPINVWREWWLRFPKNLRANTVEKRILVALKLAEQSNEASTRAHLLGIGEEA